MGDLVCNLGTPFLSAARLSLMIVLIKCGLVENLIYFNVQVATEKIMAYLMKRRSDHSIILADEGK
jgi:hypothetical protein